MADRTSAEIFGTIFRMLAEDPTDQHKEWAARLCEEMEQYDFNAYQMDADEALETLGVVELTDLRDDDDEVLLDEE